MPEASFSSTSVGFETHLLWIRKRDRFRLAIAGVIARCQQLDANAVFGISQILAVRKRREIAAAVQFFVNEFEVISCDEQNDVFGEPSQTMPEQRHPTDNRVGNAQLREPGCDGVQCLKDGTVLFEMPASLAQRPPRFAIESLFIDRKPSGWYGNIHAVIEFEQ
jgi:hypothetical protein